MEGPVLSLVLPIFNEEAIIPELDRRLRAFLAGVGSGVGESWEIIFVNDGSKDRSLALLKELAAAEPRYKIGVAHLYAAEGVPCLPIALNSGLFWPRRSLRRFPGTVVAEILDPIPPGLGKDEFFERLQNDLEGATARLIAEGRAQMKQ